MQLMKDLNMDAYRMSISWSRIFPGIHLQTCHWQIFVKLPSPRSGYRDTFVNDRSRELTKRNCMEICADGEGPEPNWEGVAYYNALLDELVNQGTAATAREQTFTVARVMSMFVVECRHVNHVRNLN